MSDTSKLTQHTIDLAGAYDERTRLFNKLRDLKMDDATRQATINEYANANRIFEDTKAAVLKLQKG